MACKVLAYESDKRYGCLTEKAGFDMIEGQFLLEHDIVVQEDHCYNMVRTACATEVYSYQQQYNWQRAGTLEGSDSSYNQVWAWVDRQPTS